MLLCFEKVSSESSLDLKKHPTPLRSVPFFEQTKSPSSLRLCGKFSLVAAMPRWVTRLQLLVFWTKFFGAHIPLLTEEGCPRHQKNGSVPICRGRGGQFGAPSKGQPN